MTPATAAKIPAHLRKYIVEQRYSRYSSEDQSVWRFILRQLRDFLGEHAHPVYLEGLKKTGITVDRIPTIDSVDQHLEKFGWGAVPVSGFIPPAAFMEFQSIGVLPVASDMRTLGHLLYTPAPDIVHEAAGHAPILVHPEYTAFLRAYGEVARFALISKQDMDQYEAIRALSDVKEDPRSTWAIIAAAEQRLNEVNHAIQGVSEAALLSRMNWWTAEYGMIGNIDKPKLYGAGLLSSVGEARQCLRPKVKKIPLSLECVDYAYDITEMQPQLFVARDFAQLTEILNQLSARLAYRLGGFAGLRAAQAAATVSSVQLNSGVQISGILSHIHDLAGEPIYLVFSGPAQLSVGFKELAEQGPARHPHGFSSPLGRLRGHANCLSHATESELGQLGIRVGQRTKLNYASGVTVEGRVKSLTSKEGRLVVVTFADCEVRLGEHVLFNTAWGEFDLAIGSEVTTVFGGPADRARFGAMDDFVSPRVPTRSLSPAEQTRATFYDRLRRLRETTGPENPAEEFRILKSAYLQLPDTEWLPGIELLELTYRLGLPDPERIELNRRLDPARFQDPSVRQCVEDGVRNAHHP